MFVRTLLCLVLLMPLGYSAFAQKQDSVGVISGTGTLPQDGVNSSYIMKFIKPNNVRFFYGTQGTAMEYGSKRQSEPGINTSVYSNVNDFVGFGITYKIIDADIFFSMPATRFVQQDLQNLTQFKFTLTYTGRKFALRGFVMDSKGMIVGDPEGRFQSSPDVHQFRTGAQVTFIFNHQRYSYRSAIFHDELQRKTAGSFLLRLEPFYRSLGVSTAIVPASLDNISTYGDQAGLQYLKAPGILVMPGYGVVVAASEGKFFVAPMIFAGPGIAFNFYKGSGGDFAYTTWEFGSMLSIDAGYNGERVYFSLSATGDMNYAPLNPSYFLTTNLRMNVTLGYRFTNLEKFIPGSF